MTSFHVSRVAHDIELLKVLTMVRARLAQRTRLRKKAKVFAMTKVSQYKYFASYTLAVIFPGV